MRRLQQTLLAQTRRIRFGYFDGKFLRFPNFQDLSIVSTHCLMGSLFYNLGHYYWTHLRYDNFEAEHLTELDRCADLALVLTLVTGQHLTDPEQLHEQ